MAIERRGSDQRHDDNAGMSAEASGKFQLTRSTFQIAGSDTTYSLFVYVFYYLAKNSELQQKLREEVKEALSLDPPNWPGLAKLRLLDSIVSETLRMHPAVPQGMTRTTPKEYVFHISRDLSLTGSEDPLLLLRPAHLS